MKDSELSGIGRTCGTVNSLVGSPQDRIHADSHILGALTSGIMSVRMMAGCQDAALVQVLAPLAIGMTVFVCHLVAIPIDGCR